jgi:hypothetical protein
MFLSLLGGVLMSVELYQILFYLNVKCAMHDLEKNYSCALGSQVDETIHHLLLGCVYSRGV